MSAAPPKLSDASDAPWPKLDRYFLEAERPPPQPFPLQVFGDAWRPWIEGHAQSSTCVDYIAQGLLAAMSAVCGSRVVVDVTPHWREPLVLWQALVGGPSTGKTPAMVAARRLLGGLKVPADGLAEPARPAKARDDADELTAWVEDRGIAHWHDELDSRLAVLSRDPKERFLVVAAWTGDLSHTNDKEIEVGRHVPRSPLSVFGAYQADRLVETLSEVDDGVSSRLLYAWPVPGLNARLDGATGDAEGAGRLLQRLVDLPGTIEQPAGLTLQEKAADRLQALLPQLRLFQRGADGLTAAWVGKAAGNIVRLAGLLSLMDWAEGDAKQPCTAIDEHHFHRAHTLWADYFWGHAQAVFDVAPPTLAERRVRRVGRWLRRTRPETVSREEVRREALSQRVDVDTAESVLERLEQYGAVRVLPVVKESRRGPRKLRWQVNPDLWAN